MEMSKTNLKSSQTCSICLITDQDLFSMPCGCGKKQEKAHLTCILERAQKHLALDTDILKKRVFEMKCEACKENIEFQTERMIVSCEEFQTIARDYKNNIIFFTPILIYLLYMFILSIIMMGEALNQGTTQYKDLSASIIMLVLTSLMMLTIIVRGGLALIKHEVRLKQEEMILIDQ